MFSTIKGKVIFSVALVMVVCTLGSLKLMGRPLDIPSLMLAIIIIGMGVSILLLLVGALHPNAFTAVTAMVLLFFFNQQHL